MTHSLKVEPGEITVVQAEDINSLTRHACQTAKSFAQKQIPVQLVNAGMMNRRFWKIAREIAPEHITDRYGSKLLCLTRSNRGQLYRERDTIHFTHLQLGTKVLIINGWEWASKNYRLKEDLIYFLRQLAEETGMAIIIYSQSRTNPTPGTYDRGGIGKLAMIALTVERLTDRDEIEEETSREDEDAAEVFAQLLAQEINNLPAVRAEEDERMPIDEEEFVFA